MPSTIVVHRIVIIKQNIRNAHPKYVFMNNFCFYSKSISLLNNIIIIIRLLAQQKSNYRATKHILSEYNKYVLPKLNKIKYLVES